VDEDLVEDVSDVPIARTNPLAPMIPERLEGRQYFLPFRPNVQVAYVNRRRFAQAGVTPRRPCQNCGRGRQLKATAGGIARVTLRLPREPRQPLRLPSGS